MSPTVRIEPTALDMRGEMLSHYASSSSQKQLRESSLLNVVTLLCFFPNALRRYFFPQRVSMLSRDAYVTHVPGVGFNSYLSHLR